MSERPILFSAEMVRAILGGHKTQTRRVMKPQPEIVANPSALGRVYLRWDKSKRRRVYGLPESLVSSNPFAQEVGGRLWVRETFAYKSIANQQVFYRADFHNCAPWDGADMVGAWRPSIHMPRWASRITLEVINIRVERVQDISVSDMRAEGVEYGPHNRGEFAIQHTIREWKTLWDSINAKRGYSWESNPWVWMVEFKRI